MVYNKGQIYRKAKMVEIGKLQTGDTFCCVGNLYIVADTTGGKKLINIVTGRENDCFANDLEVTMVDINLQYQVSMENLD